MPGHDIVAIGALAGGVETLVKIVADLPSDFPAALFVVLHIPKEPKSLLPSTLSNAGPLKARHAVDGEEIQNGLILVAPPDQHRKVPARERIARGLYPDSRACAISATTRAAQEPGSGSCVMGRPTTRRSAPAWIAKAGVAIRF